MSLHRDRHQREQRAQQHQQHDRAEHVERALDDPVEALEHRGAQLEQRHGLAGDEVRAVDEDLHRRRRDPHAHAAPVALVDELDRLLLGERGVGDDHLVDLLALDDLAQVAELPERLDPVVRARRQRDEADDVDRGHACRAPRRARGRRTRCAGPVPTSTARRW